MEVYSLITLEDEIIILRNSQECFSLRKEDLAYALELYRNLVDGAVA